MPQITVLQYDAFTSEPNRGNPAGVVLNADHLSGEDMQQIAAKIGFNETVFVRESEAADVRLTYYTPGHEMNLCGHATVGSLFCMKTRGLWKELESLRIETKAGILPVSFRMEAGGLYVTMKQSRPEFHPFGGSKRELAAAIGLMEEELESSKPLVYGSTGAWTLIVPIAKLASFRKMRPENKRFPDILSEMPHASVHPICLEAYDRGAFMHARHFSSPYSGTIEDPVTGTASGVMGAYYVTYLDPYLSSLEFTVEQGTEIGKDGRVKVYVHKKPEETEVSISGTAVYVREFEVDY